MGIAHHPTPTATTGKTAPRPDATAKGHDTPPRHTSTSPADSADSPRNTAEPSHEPAEPPPQPTAPDQKPPHHAAPEPPIPQTRTTRPPHQQPHKPRYANQPTDQSPRNNLRANESRRRHLPGGKKVAQVVTGRWCSLPSDSAQGHLQADRNVAHASEQPEDYTLVIPRQEAPTTRDEFRCLIQVKCARRDEMLGLSFGPCCASSSTSTSPARNPS